MKILLACQTATNKGDRAIAEYLITALTAQGHEVILSTTRPALWEDYKAEGVSVIPMGYRSLYRNIKRAFAWKLARAFHRFVYDPLLFASLLSQNGKHRFCSRVSGAFIAAVREADLVIVTGGHHITTIREKNALFQFTYDIGLVSLYARRYVLWAQTIGPLEFTSASAKSFIERIIRKADKVFIRDENSRTCLENLYGKFDNLSKTYDTVFGYGSLCFPAVSEREKKVGIAVFNGLKKAFHTYDTLAQMLDFYAARDYEIEFFRMEYDDFELESIRQITSRMKRQADVRIHPFLTTTIEHLREVASCRCFIGYKTHSVIMALATATPLIAIAYHEKTADFMKDFDLADYVIPDMELDYKKAEDCMISMEDHLESIQQKQIAVARRIAETIRKDLSDTVNDADNV